MEAQLCTSNPVLVCSVICLTVLHYCVGLRKACLNSAVDKASMLFKEDGEFNLHRSCVLFVTAPEISFQRFVWIYFKTGLWRSCSIRRRFAPDCREECKGNVRMQMKTPERHFKAAMGGATLHWREFIWGDRIL